MATDKSREIAAQANGWIVTRVVREKFWVQEATDRQNAKDLAENPYSVQVVSETARRAKPDEDYTP